MQTVLATLDSTKYAPLLREMFRARREIFYDELGYKTTPVPGGERDEYDTARTRYVLGVASGRLVAFTRLNPTTSDYMIADVWPEQLEGPAPRASNVVEGSRLAVNPRLRGAERQEAVKVLVSGMFGDCRQRGVREIIGVMPPRYWSSVFVRWGVPVRYRSPVFFTDEPVRSEAAQIGVIEVPEGEA